jgi:hypothetical protein
MNMAKGPAYTDEEQRVLEKLAKKGGSPTVLAKEFLSTLAGNDRPETALVQKIRKMILDLKVQADPAAAPAPRKRTPKVNAAPLSDVPPAPTPGPTLTSNGKRKGRPPKVKPVAESQVANGHTNGNTNGNGNTDVITVDLGGLTLVGTKKRVGEALQQLG